MVPQQLALVELQGRFNESNYSKDLAVPGFTPSTNMRKIRCVSEVFHVI